MTPEAEQLAAYIVKDVIGRAGVTLTEDTALVSSGMIDSMALVGILAVLEDVTKRRIPAGKVQPKDLDTIRLMLATAERVGKPRPAR